MLQNEITVAINFFIIRIIMIYDVTKRKFADLFLQTTLCDSWSMQKFSDEFFSKHTEVFLLANVGCLVLQAYQPFPFIMAIR